MFHLFASKWGDGEGGMNDYKGSFETVEEVQDACDPKFNYVWIQIVVPSESGGLRLHTTGAPVYKTIKLDTSWLDDSIKAEGTAIPTHGKVIIGYKWTRNYEEDPLA